MIHVRSSRGKNSQGRKVTGIEPMPGEDKVIAWHHLNIGRYDIVRVKWPYNSTKREIFINDFYFLDIDNF